MAPGIRGLQYVPEYLNAAAQDRLLAEVDSQPWLVAWQHEIPPRTADTCLDLERPRSRRVSLTYVVP
jgi:hypothetical protein